MLTARLRPAPGQDDALRAWLKGPGLALLGEPTGVVGVHLLETVAEATRVRTAEGKLKGGEVGAAEEPWPWAVLVECSDAAVAHALVGGPLRSGTLVERGAAPDGIAAVYSLQVTMDRA